MNRETMKDDMLNTLLALAFLSPAIVAGCYWLVTGKSILTIFGW